MGNDLQTVLLLYSAFPCIFRFFGLTSSDTVTTLVQSLLASFLPSLSVVPAFFPKSVGQIPFAFPFKPGSDESSSTSVYGALYPFGHGLSYTTFTYSDLHISPSHQGVQGDIHVSCKIKNTGKIKGDEVVQLYLRDEISSVTTYTKVLRGFERISLKAGEEQTVHFRLRPQDLGLWDKNMNFRVELGSFKVMLGASSTDIRLHGQFEITP